MHLKIADAIERLRATSMESHASLLAHHLYQAGAAADVARTAKFLMLAGRRALAASAFEETLEIMDQVIGLELSVDDPLLAEAFEHRGSALNGMQRPDEAIAALERALALHEARHDDEGIRRAAAVLGMSFVFRARFADCVAACNRALKALSTKATRERASLLAFLTAPSLNVVPVDVAWAYLEQASALAEGLNDRVVTGDVLHAKTVAHGLCAEYEASVESGREALPLLQERSIGQRADLMMNILMSNFVLGRFAEVDVLAPEVLSLARRAGMHAILAFTGMCVGRLALYRSGDFRAYQKGLEDELQVAPFSSWLRVPLAATLLHLGEVREVLEQFAKAVAAPMFSLAHKGIPQANIFAAEALAGFADEARRHWKDVETCLPIMGRRSVFGPWLVLDSSITGLAILDERERCGALYPLCAAYAEVAVIGGDGVGTGDTQTNAGIVAHAAGLREKSREHFEIAIRRAHELPNRPLQPTARYWYGRMLLEDPQPDERARGRAMIEAAEIDFRSLGMVVYANLASRLLAAAG
jgi:tetratricopeptide (TPR) repeat protein